MKIIKNLNDFIKESVEEVTVVNDNIFDDVISTLEQEYNLIDVNDDGEQNLYFFVEGEHSFNLFKENNTISIFTEIKDGDTDTLGCFEIDENIVETLTHVIRSYCEQTIEE